MDQSTKHLQLAAKIDVRMQELERVGCNDVEILVQMFDIMPDFKWLMDTLGQDGMNQLCVRFDGFYRYAKILESLANGIASGQIKVPR